MPTHPSSAATIASPPARRRPRVNGLLVLLAVATLHLLLLSWLQPVLRSPPPQPVAPQTPALQVRQLPAAPRAAPPPQPEAPPRREVLRRPARVPAPAATPAAPAAEPGADVPDLATAPQQPPAGAAPTAAGAPAGGLLDTEASRRAIRDSARRPSTAEMGAQATGADAPLSAQERLGQDIARGARGDCLKGEYAGAGMGLLSLPFWLIAELREKCRR